MILLDEIAHRHGATTNRVTDFYFVGDRCSDPDLNDRFKVVEVASPERIVGGEAVQFRFDYTVHTFRATGWVEVAKMGDEHADSPLQAAQIAEGILHGHR